MKPDGYIVVYDDGQGAYWPYSFDGTCEGAIECFMNISPVALFPDRKTAQRAIRISRQFALLQQAQGKPNNTDFTDPKCVKNIKIVPLTKGTVTT